MTQEEAAEREMREQFEAWLKTTPEFDEQFKQHKAWADHYAWLAWRASRAAVPQWQPIETAPKDDAVLLSDGYSVGEGFWHDGSQCYGHRGSKGWFWEADRGDLLIASNAYATHWMPLPAPPITPQGAPNAE